MKKMAQVGIDTAEESYRLSIPEEFVGDISDGYHTFNELYKHRHHLFCMVLLLHGGWKSWNHEAGSAPMYEDYFIAGTALGGKPVSYHLPSEYWNMAKVPELPCAMHWDGHTSDDVLARIKEFIEASQSQ